MHRRSTRATTAELGERARKAGLAALAATLLGACATQLPTVPALGPDGSVALGKVVWHDLVTPDLDRAQAFYGATLRQVELTVDTLADLEIVHQDRLSAHRDADILASIAALQQSSSAEEFAIQVAARQRPTILDVLA